MTTATDEAVAATDVVDGVAIKPENVERRVYAVLDESGDLKKYEQVSVADFDAWEKQDKNKNKQVMIKQTFREYTVGSLDGLATLIGDDEEAVNIVNRGIAQKTSQKVNSVLLEVNDKNELVFEPTEDVVDTRDMLQEPTKRRSLSPIEKLGRDAKKAGFDSTLVMALIQQLQAAQQTATAIEAE